MGKYEVIGQKIVGVRWMTEEEAFEQGWDALSVVVELSNGIKLYPSTDEEGNMAGVLFGTDSDGEDFYVVAEEEE